MSSPGHKARSTQEEKRYARIRARMSQAEQQATEAIQELHFRMSSPYMQSQLQRFLQDHYADWCGKLFVSYRKWSTSMVNIFATRPFPAALIALGGLSSGASNEMRAGEDPWADVKGEGQQTSKGAESPFGFTEVRTSSCVEPSLDNSWLIEKKDDQQTGPWDKETEPGNNQMKNKIFLKLASMRETLVRGVNRHPLAMGAVVVTLGAAIAAALPRSRQEDRWMGDVREKMKKSITPHIHLMVEEVKQETKHALRNVWKEEKSPAVPMRSTTVSKKGMSHDANEKYVLHDEDDDSDVDVCRVPGGAGRL